MSHTGALLAQQDYSPFYHEGTDSLAGDATTAGTLLDTAGWTMDSTTNMRTNSDGDELTLHLVAYPHRPGLPIMQPVIADALTALGITVTSTLTGNDWSETSSIMNARTFDLLSEYSNGLPQPLATRSPDANRCCQQHSAALQRVAADHPRVGSG